MYIIGLSGPPRSGKDSIASYLAAHIEDVRGVQPQILSLSLPMRQAAFTLAGLIYEPMEYERIKDEVGPVLGVSIRTAMIQLSEEFVKPKFGHDFWARSLVGHLWNPVPPILIVPDMGFDAERLFFESMVGVENCVWAQVRRPDHDFSKDFRSYIGEGARVTILDNDREGMDSVLECACRLYGRLVNKFKWVI